VQRVQLRWPWRSLQPLWSHENRGRQVTKDARGPCEVATRPCHLVKVLKPVERGFVGTVAGLGLVDEVLVRHICDPVLEQRRRFDDDHRLNNVASGVDALNEGNELVVVGRRHDHGALVAHVHILIFGYPNAAASLVHVVHVLGLSLVLVDNVFVRLVEVSGCWRWWGRLLPLLLDFSNTFLVRC
jgi:hypothetical protein